jgi:hypothetical protein
MTWTVVSQSVVVVPDAISLAADLPWPILTA